ncbi:unnamed protein product [Phytophthora lilii]|uniref:Unnamed protein product n=1 Tax=Phytophthora lilii TaxID=2077276 RepID=A0A9W7D8H2_9STRA|nr:unnamed protein product [Phytophthora lilii]
MVLYRLYLNEQPKREEKKREEMAKGSRSAVPATSMKSSGAPSEASVTPLLPMKTISESSVAFDDLMDYPDAKYDEDVAKRVRAFRENPRNPTSLSLFLLGATGAARGGGQPRTL